MCGNSPTLAEPRRTEHSPVATLVFASAILLTVITLKDSDLEFLWKSEEWHKQR